MYKKICVSIRTRCVTKKPGKLHVQSLCQPLQLAAVASFAYDDQRYTMALALTIEFPHGIKNQGGSFVFLKSANVEHAQLRTARVTPQRFRNGRYPVLHNR